jgi:hypothetical protein
MNNEKLYFIYGLLDPFEECYIDTEFFNFSFKPFYIGRGRRRNRPMSHIKEAKYTEKNSHKLNKIRSIINNGAEPFIVIIKSDITKEEADLIERKLIKDMGKRKEGGILTNLADGGEGGIGGITTKGKKLSSDHRKKISEGGKGLKRSEETKKRISISKKGQNKGKKYEDFMGEEKASIARKELSEKNRGIRNPFYGKSHSEESRGMIGNKNRGIKRSNEFKEKISQMNLKRSDEISKKNSKMIKITDLSNGEITNVLGLKNACVFSKTHKIYLGIMINKEGIYYRNGFSFEYI